MSSATSPTIAPSVTSAPSPAPSTSTSVTCPWPCAISCVAWARSASAPRAAAAAFFLEATNPNTIKLARTAVVGVGYRAQRLANRVLQPLARAQTRKPPATTGKPRMVEQVVHFVNKRMPGGLPTRTARALLDIEDRAYVPIIRDPLGRPQRPRRCSIFPAAAQRGCSHRSDLRPKPCSGM